MLKPEKLVKTTIVGPKSVMRPVIEKLYDLKILHIKEHNKDTFFDIGNPFEENEQLTTALVKIRAVASFLNVDLSDNVRAPPVSDLPSVEKQAGELYERTQALHAESAFNTKILALRKGSEEIDFLEQFPTSLKADLTDSVYFIGFVSGSIESDVQALTKHHDLLQAEYKGQKLVALIVRKKDTEKFQTLLNERFFSPIEKPTVKAYFESIPGESAVPYTKRGQEIKRLEGEINRLQNEKNLLARKNARFLKRGHALLANETDKAEAPLRFATTKNTFVAEGWVPQKNFKTVKAALEKVSDNKVHVEMHKIGEHENTPVKLNAPRFVKPFQFFLDLYTIPKYGEIDPTFLLFLTFPFFFGMMLGDVGYGLITMAIFMYAKKKAPGAKDLLNALIIASIATIIFGVAFGEYFGVETFPHDIGKSLCENNGICFLGEQNGETIYNFPHLFARSHQIADLLSISVLFGVIHILLGLVIGFYNVWHEHNIVHAIKEKLGWILLMPGVYYLLNMLNIFTGGMYEPFFVSLSPSPMVAAITGGIGIVLVIIGEGVMGVIELPGLFSNVLSYARLMAVGLASLSLAVVVNDMAAGMFHGSVALWPVGVLVLLLGHGINILLGILSPFLHSLRLHYVEFFTKFYSGGGFKFTAFGEKIGGK